MLHSSNPPSIADPDLAQFYGDAALPLLSSFRFTVRYIDDLTSGPNPWLAALLHTSQSVMGRIILGIYPTNLSLKFTGSDPANPDVFHTFTLGVLPIVVPPRLRFISSLTAYCGFNYVLVHWTLLVCMNIRIYIQPEIMLRTAKNLARAGGACGVPGFCFYISAEYSPVFVSHQHIIQHTWPATQCHDECIQADTQLCVFFVPLLHVCLLLRSFVLPAAHCSRCCQCAQGFMCLFYLFRHHIVSSYHTSITYNFLMARYAWSGAAAVSLMQARVYVVICKSLCSIAVLC